jgi:Icc-related predicted phosphoesterase
LGIVRVAAVADVHCHEHVRGRLAAELASVSDQADALVLAGDLTLVGHPSEARILVDELRGVRIPVLAVLGNHDHELDQQQVIADMLRANRVHVLEGESAVLSLNGSSVGFAGIKGFCGGFDNHLVAPFGEQSLKAFVRVGLAEARKLEISLRALRTDYRVVVLHYAPIRDTLIGESPELFPFLGSSSLCRPVDEIGADVVFHGHAHYGTRFGRTPGGIPVYNVAHALVRGYVVHTLGVLGQVGRLAPTP